MNTYQNGLNRPRKKFLGHACVILSSEIFKFLRIINKKLSPFLLLTVFSQGLVSTLNLIVFIQDPPQCLKSFFRMHSDSFLSYSKKRKISQNDPSLSVTRCHSLSLDVICCTTHCHSLSLVLIRCQSLYHSLSLDISLVCLFINDLIVASFLSFSFLEAFFFL